PTRRSTRPPAPPARRRRAAVAEAFGGRSLLALVGWRVVPVLRGRHAFDRDQLDRVGRFLDDDVELVALALGGPAQHVVGTHLAARGLPDPDSHAKEVRALEVLVDRSQAVVPREPATD